MFPMFLMALFTLAVVGEKDTVLRTKWGVRNTGMQHIYEAVERSSNPMNERFYGVWMSHEEVLKVTGGHVSGARALMEREEGVKIVGTSKDGLWLTVEMYQSKVETLLATRCLRGVCEAPYRIPPHLEAYFDVVLGLAPLKVPQQMLKRTRKGDASSICSSWPSYLMTIERIQSLYNLDPSVDKIVGSTSGAVFEVDSLAETFDPEDLASFQSLSSLPQQAVTQFAGNTNVTLGCDSYKCMEPNTDVQLFMGIAPGINFTYYTWSLESGNPILDYLSGVSSEQDPPLIHSISWGPPESHLDAASAARILEETAKNVARGLTFVTSSGDDGVNYRAARGNPAACGLSPQYPANNPYMVAVGGTFGPEFGQPERTAETDDTGLSCSITSGGGFSAVYPQLSYQKAAVATYLSSSPPMLPPASAFNATNRAYPGKVSGICVYLNRWSLDAGFQNSDSALHA